MKKRKAANIAASFRPRLLSLSPERKEDFQFVLGRWIIERFLYRLSVSQHKEDAHALIAHSLPGHAG